MNTTADRLDEVHLGRHITLIDAAGSVSGTLRAYDIGEDYPDPYLRPVTVLVEIFNKDYELKVSPHTEVEISDI